jgi:hypothetical protein
MRGMLSSFLVCCAFANASAQAPVQAPETAPPPPATKLEAFKPATGSVLTIGRNDLGQFGGVTVDARELRDTKGGVVRGVVVEVSQGQYRDERSFIDADELAELIKGIDALLAVKTNPTGFQQFEVRYRTKGELEITAYSIAGRVQYWVQAGRTLHAQSSANSADLLKLKTMFEAAVQQFAALGAK